MSKTKKEYLSEPINVELDWINDIRNSYIRSNMRKLDLSISITYTYFIYHDYTVAQLAKINKTTERQVIVWILIAAYTLDGGEYRFGEGLIDTVLVKDMSRLGRHRTQTALFLDYLTENNVNMISVTESIDSANENDDLIIGFKQIVNDLYCKDISRKVKAGIRQKQKSSGVIESLPIGYVADRINKRILVDPEAATIVRDVFDMFLEGYGLTTIAREMNRRGVKSPEYYQRRKLADWKPDFSKRYLWVQTAVKRILTNEIYIGTMVNHKSVTSEIYKTKSFIDKNEQFRHENFCEAIIDKETWDQAQFLLGQRSVIHPRSNNGNKLHRYAGILKCAECGANLTARTRHWKGSTYVQYSCNTSHRYGKEYCTPHTIREDMLDALLKDEMKSWYKHIISEGKKYEHIVKEWQRKKPAYDKKIQENEQKIEKLNEDIENLIMERLNDLGRKELYDKMIKKKQKEVKELDKKNKELKQYNLVCKKRQEELDNFAEFLKEVLAQDTISDISMRMVVNKIVVHQNEDKTLDIKFEMNGKLGDNKEIEIPE